MRVSVFLLTANLLALPVQTPAQRMTCAHADSVARSDARSRDDRELAIAKLHYRPDVRVAAITALLRGSKSNPVSNTLGAMAAWALFDSALVDSVDRARAAIEWMAHHNPDARLRAFAAQVSEELAEMWAAGLQKPSRPR